VAKETAKKKKTEKPISVPNKCPFKEEMLMEAEKKREERKEEQEQRKMQQKIGKKNQQQVSKKRKITNETESIEALAKRAAREEVYLSIIYIYKNSKNY
jgi:nuclear GTP-binding protein